MKAREGPPGHHRNAKYAYLFVETVYWTFEYVVDQKSHIKRHFYACRTSIKHFVSFRLRGSEGDRCEYQCPKGPRGALRAIQGPLRASERNTCLVPSVTRKALPGGWGGLLLGGLARVSVAWPLASSLRRSRHRGLNRCDQRGSLPRGRWHREGTTGAFQRRCHLRKYGGRRCSSQRHR